MTLNSFRSMSCWNQNFESFVDNSSFTGFGSFKITFTSGSDWLISNHFLRKCVRFNKMIFNQPMSLLNVKSSYVLHLWPVAAFFRTTIAFILWSPPDQNSHHCRVLGSKKIACIPLTNLYELQLTNLWETENVLLFQELYCFSEIWKF